MFLGVCEGRRQPEADAVSGGGAWPGKVWEHPVVFVPISDNGLGRKDWRPPAKCTIALDCNPEMCETRTCTNRGMVCMLAISPLLMGSLAMMWSAPVQPSTISSIRTPSCTEQEGERRAVRVFQRQKEDPTWNNKGLCFGLSISDYRVGDTAERSDLFPVPGRFFRTCHSVKQKKPTSYWGYTAELCLLKLLNLHPIITEISEKKWHESAMRTSKKQRYHLNFPEYLWRRTF